MKKATGPAPPFRKKGPGTNTASIKIRAKKYGFINEREKSKKLALTFFVLKQKLPDKTTFGSREIVLALGPSAK